MPSEQEISQIRDYAAEGFSLNQIKEKLNLPKSTVYYHFRKEVGQKQKENSLEIPEDEEVRGEICGIFAGDGGYQYYSNRYKYQIRFHLNYNHEYWKVLAEYLEKKLDKAPNIYTYPEKSKTILNYTSKKLYQCLKSKLYWEEDKTESIKLRSEIELEEGFKIGFLRGLIDTDGYRRPNHKRYVFTSISENLISNSAKLLESLDISHTVFEEEDPRNHRTKHKIRITGQDVDKFQSIIQPRNPKRLYK